MTGRSQGGMGRTRLAAVENAAACDQLMNTPVVLQVAASPASPPLVLRPWRMEDVAALVEVSRDPALRQWASSVVDDDADGARWVQAQQRGWAEGAGSASPSLRLNPVQFANSWWATWSSRKSPPANRRPRWATGPRRTLAGGVAPRALEALTGWAFDTFEADGLERLELLHQVDNLASCRVAQKSRYDFDSVLPAAPPSFPRDGHLHIRRADA